MPQRPYQSAIGYDTNPTLPAVPAEVKQPKDLVEWAGNTFSGAVDTTVAGFRLENDVVNGLELLSRPAFQPEPDFNLEGTLRGEGLWDKYKWNFIGVDSRPEYDYVLAKIRREEKDRATVAAAGVGGLVSQVAAGILSPTILLPFVGELRGVKALVSGAGWGFVGGVAQEVPLQLNQETRTIEESAFSVGMSTLVGGVLGGAVGFLTKPLDDVARDMADIPGKEAIPEAPFASIGPKGVGAEAAPPRVDAGRLAGALGQEDEFLSRLGPVTRVLQSTSQQARWMMAQLSDAGLALKGNIEGIATSVGGTAENNILVHWAKAADSVRLIDDAFARYRLGKSQVGLRDKISASFKGMTPTGGKLSKKQFREAVGRAMFNQDASEIPEVAEVAAFVRKRVYDELYQRAQEVGIYKRALPDDESGDVAKVVGDQSYLNRDYKLEVVAARRTEFVDILTKHFAQKLGADYTAELQKLLDRAAKDAERLEDMQRTPEEVEQLQQKFREQIEALDMARTEEEAALDDYIADLRSMAADRNLPKEQRKDARDMAKLLGETGGAAERQAKRRELKRRLNNLNRSFAMRNKTLGNKLQRVSRIEELSLNTMNRTVRAAQKFLKQAAQLSDEKFAEEISKLKNKFAKLAGQYDRGEEQISKVLRDGREEQKPIDFAHNMEIARAQGFTARGYHGTNDIIDKFQPGKTRLQRGVFFSDRPELANKFAFGKATDSDDWFEYYDEGFIERIEPYLARSEVEELRPVHARYMELGYKRKRTKKEEAEWKQLGARLRDRSMEVTATFDFDKGINPVPGGKSPNVTPALLRLGKTYEVQMPGRFDWDIEAEAVKYAKENGYDSLTIRLPATPDEPEQVIYSLFKEEDIRSPYDNFADDLPTQDDRLLGLDMRQQDRAGRLSNIAEELDFVEQLDRESLRLLVQEGLDELLVKTNRINGRRFARAQRLRDEVKNLDPKMVEKEIDNIRKGMDDRTRNFFDKWQENGASKVEVRAEHTPDFTTYAKQTAEKVTDKILGTNARLAGMDLIMEPKGAELARVLDIDSNAIMDFLETDIEHLVSQYIRTLAPDIEIMKKLGEYAPDMGRNLEFEKLNMEQSDRVRALETSMKAEGKSKEQIEKAVQKVNHEYAMVRRDLQAVIGRLRHEWGVPADPTAIMTRIGRVAMNLNVLRYMNMVTISSLPDIAGPIMKYGMMRTFRKGWVPFIKQLRNLQFDNRELRLAGAALDVVLHSRAHAISDVGDYMVRGSKFEKGTEWLTSKIGLVALFDYWTAAMKQVAGSAANAKVMDDIRLLMDGGGTEAQRAKATEFLASAGINEDLARAIWKEIQKPGGSDIVDGVLWPNTEAWDNASGAVDAYRSALLREVNRTIVTPGVERPLMSDANLTAKLIFQFKSFALSSTTKIFLSGLQQRDMAVAQGTMISLALGALSYYIWANITGGKALEDMNAALEDFDGEGWKKFADEAISRSGILASISMGQDIMSTLPIGGQYVNFSGQRSSRQADNDVIDALGGPSLDLLRRAVRALPGTDNETGDLQWDRSQMHQLRLMLPFQNHFALRQIYDAIERAVSEND